MMVESFGAQVEMCGGNKEMEMWCSRTGSCGRPASS